MIQNDTHSESILDQSQVTSRGIDKFLKNCVCSRKYIKFPLSIRNISCTGTKWIIEKEITGWTKEDTDVCWGNWNRSVNILLRELISFRLSYVLLYLHSEEYVEVYTVHVLSQYNNTCPYAPLFWPDNNVYYNQKIHIITWFVLQYIFSY